MTNRVFANGREVACKASSGKSICAFPDVCLTPPSPPAGPIPIPYPNTGMASDCTDGSSSVKVSGKEILLKNKSYFKSSLGDEAATKSLGMSVITHQIQGKVYFASWSMDVKFEGENSVRHLDMTTHNHASQPGATPPWPFASRMAMANVPGCEGERQKVKDACGENGENLTCPDTKPLTDAKNARAAAKKAHGDGSAQHKKAQKSVEGAIDGMANENKADECRRKMRCVLSTYENDKCCPGQTPHHLVEAGAFYDEGRGGETKKKNVRRAIFVKSMFAATEVDTVASGPGSVVSDPIFGAGHYDEGAAPCVCCEGESQHQGTHKLLHQAQGKAAAAAPGVPNPNPFKQLSTAKGEPAKMQRLDGAISSGSNAVQEVFPESKCDPACTEAQLKEYHYNKAKMNPELPIKAVDGNGKALPAK